MISRRPLFGLAAAAFAPAAARAQTWAPTRPVRLVVPIAAGGALDITARMLGEKLSPPLGQPVVVENRAGGRRQYRRGIRRAGGEGRPHPADRRGQYAGGEQVPLWLAHADRPAEGACADHPRLHRYHPAGGERPAPVEEVSELVAAAKKEPGKITMGSSGTGTTSHLYMELVKRVAGIDITHVPYRGGGPAIQDLLAGNIDMMFDVMPALMPHVREGRFRALAVGSAERITYVPGLEDVPGMNELLPGKGVDAQVWYATMAPAGTPEPVLARLHALITQVAKAPEFGARLIPLGFQPLTDASPEAFGAFWRGEEARWKTLVEISGAQAE